MSYINIHKLEFLDQMDDDTYALPDIAKDNRTASLTDGEEIRAAARLLRELDALGEGEALVVWKDIF